MKKTLIVLIILMIFNSCKECDCFEYPRKPEVSQKNNETVITFAKSTICHFDALNNTYTTMSFNNDVQLQNHVDSHNLDDVDTVGECVALGIEDYDLTKPTYFPEGDCSDDGAELRSVNGEETFLICN